MARGFKTGGRKPGSKNKRTAEREAATEELVVQLSEALGVAAFSGDAHALLVMVYKNETLPIDMRIDAAKAAIRFEKPTLGVVESGPNALERYVARVPNKAATPDEWQEQHSPAQVH